MLKCSGQHWSLVHIFFQNIVDNNNLFFQTLTKKKSKMVTLSKFWLHFVGNNCPLSIFDYILCETMVNCSNFGEMLWITMVQCPNFDEKIYG